MIKLFRNIRQNLLNEGKTSKYFKYAIGEIVLVVIGILIALQINNWNSNRIQKQKESIYVANIKRDLKEQLTTIKSQMAYETNINKIATPMISYYKAHQGFKIDSVFTANIGSLTGRKTFVKNSPTYTELISSGNIDIISDNIIKDDIIKYYQELERIELVINKNNNLYTDAVFIPEMIGLSEMQVSKEFEINKLLNYIPNQNIPLIDLNEPRLKQIMEQQLENPENELKMINCINFRNFIAIIHTNLLSEQKINTQLLLDKLETKN
ncbi:DUF6090 family protein [Gaetbulibacter aquiaggeris]|uniref:DUF6090 family protein n=1 Tax=Gaetbulibacter aquiaggeris TaxID=1735373 RepID=A0ABW7MN84_9FLAO